MTMARVDPRVRACGKARIDVTRRAKNEQDWQQLWREPRYPFPFQWGQGWKQAFQYQVDDFAAEVGFLMDVLGLPVCAFSPSYALFTSPDQVFTFGVIAAPQGGAGTPPDTIRIQFMVEDLLETAEELERRGVHFERKPEPDPSSGSSLQQGCFRTPHGVAIDLLGWVQHPLEFAAGTTGAQEYSGLWVGFFNEPEPAPAADFQPVHRPEPHRGETIPSAEPAPTEEGENPLAGLTFDPRANPSPWGETLPPAGTGPEELSDRPNGSEPQSRDFPPPGAISHRLPQRRSAPFPRAGSLRRPGAPRANGEQRWPDSLRRPVNDPRKNPFNLLDLPPLPEMPAHLNAPPNPAPAREPPGEIAAQDPPLPGQKQAGPEVGPGQSRKELDQTLRAPPVDEPRYEDLDDSGGSKDMDDFYA